MDIHPTLYAIDALSITHAAIKFAEIARLVSRFTDRMSEYNVCVLKARLAGTVNDNFVMTNCAYTEGRVATQNGDSHVRVQIMYRAFTANTRQ